jgi:hypothetical protein
LPFFEGPRAKLAYLSGLGVTHLLVVDPDTSTCLYREAIWKVKATELNTIFREWASWFLDWLEDVRVMTTGDFGAQRYGDLYLIPTVATGTSTDSGG